MCAEWTFATRFRQIKSSAIREILKVTAQPDIISFAGGLPAPELFPVDILAQACAQLFADEKEAAAALQYSTTEGYPPLKQAIIRRAQTRGITLTEQELLITHGSQQGLDLVTRAFVNPGDYVAIDNPGYLGAIQIFQVAEARMVPLEIDREGTVPESLEEALKRYPIKLVYLTPTFHNPLGVTMSLERRRRIAELAEKTGVVIVEDDPYGELRYSGEDLPSLRALSSRIVGLGTFSKILVPGFRLGWVAADKEIIEKLVMLKQATDLHTNSFSQRLTALCLESGFLDEHIQRLRQVYAQRRQIMLEAFEEHLSDLATWSPSEGGLFIWVELKDDLDSQELLLRAVEHKVAFVPGVDFYVANPRRNTFRVNFSNSTPEQLRTGVAALRKAILSMKG